MKPQLQETMSVAQAAKKWKLTVQRVRVLLAAGRVPGAELIQESRGPVWRIPKNAKQPEKIRPGRKVEQETT